jgi:mono/diheme cytochrome c family protein
MKQIIRSFARLLFGVPALWPSLWGLDPAHGEQVFREQNCLNCHLVGVSGSLAAPDLGAASPANDTPAALASSIWNHIPIMTPALAGDRVPLPRMSERDAEDMFVYLYSIHFPDNSGDSRRGRQVFGEESCSSCHTLNPEGNRSVAKPVSDWKRLNGPFTVVQEMWNHSSTMKSALAKRSKPLFSITGQELADLGAYISALQQTRSFRKAAREPALTDPLAGKPLFDANCGQFHKQLVSLQSRLSNQPSQRSARIYGIMRPACWPCPWWSRRICAKFPRTSGNYNMKVRRARSQEAREFTRIKVAWSVIRTRKRASRCSAEATSCIRRTR